MSPEQRLRALALLVRGRVADHALGPPGRARGVDDAHGRALRRLRPRLGRGQPLGPAERALGDGRSRAAAAVRIGLGVRWDDHDGHLARHALGDPGPQVLVHDQHLRAAVEQHVLDLLAAPVPVDRHGARSERHGRDRGLEELDRVAQQQRDAVACVDAERTQAAGRPQRPAEQLRIRAEASAAANADLLLLGHRGHASWARRGTCGRPAADPRRA